MTRICKYVADFQATGLFIDRKRTRGRRRGQLNLDKICGILETSSRKALLPLAQQEGMFALLARSSTKLLHCEPYKTILAYKLIDTELEATVNF
jgi:hypothetical protein